jgi:hypoxanthine phosphoribosyltransferase
VKNKNFSQPLILLIVLKGGMYFGVELSKALADFGVFHIIDTIHLKRYGENEKGGKIELLSEPTENFEGKNIIVAEDVVDQGDTFDFLHKYIMEKNPSSVEYCILAEKKHKPLDVKVSYRVIDHLLDPEEWLVGFGMDSNKLFRGLNYICVKIKTPPGSTPEQKQNAEAPIVVYRCG